MSIDKTCKCPHCGSILPLPANKCPKCGKNLEKITSSNSALYTKSSSNTQNSLDINTVDSEGFSAMLNEEVNPQLALNDETHSEGRKLKRFNIFGRKYN